MKKSEYQILGVSVHKNFSDRSEKKLISYLSFLKRTGFLASSVPVLTHGLELCNKFQKLLQMKVSHTHVNFFTSLKTAKSLSTPLCPQDTGTANRFSLLYRVLLYLILLEKLLIKPLICKSLSVIY